MMGNSSLSSNLKNGTTLWTLFRGSIVWICWLERNARCFREESWVHQKIEALLWEEFIDHGKTAWYRTKRLIQSRPDLSTRFLSQFDMTWSQNEFFCTRQGVQVLGS